MTTPITKEQRIEEVETLIDNAEEWASFYEHPIHDKPHRDMFEGMARVMREYLAALKDARACSRRCSLAQRRRRAYLLYPLATFRCCAGPLFAVAQPVANVPTFDEWLEIRGNKPLGWVKDAMRESYDACRAAMLQAGNSPVIPDDWQLVPKRLTAENGAKGALSGEFSETKFINCPECFGDDDCETCDGSGRIEISVPVTWTTIKAIWAKGVEHFSEAPQQERK